MALTQEGGVSNLSSKLEGGDGGDSCGRRPARRHYVTDPCRGGGGRSGSEVEGERLHPPSGGERRFSASVAPAETDTDDEGDEETYGCRDGQRQRQQQRQQSRRSYVVGQMSAHSDNDDDDAVIVDCGMQSQQPGDVLCGRGVLCDPLTLPGGLHHAIRRPHPASSVSSGTGTV